MASANPPTGPCCAVGPKRWLAHVFFGQPLVEEKEKAVPLHAPHTMKNNLVVNGKDHVFTNYYEVVEAVGSGSFGNISLAKEKTYKFERAMKVTRCAARTQATINFEKEVELHGALDHPNIIRLFESYTARGRHHVVMELCKGGTVEDVLTSRGQALASMEADRLFSQMMGAIQYLHSKGIAHRDLKLQNLLLKESLADTEIKNNTLKVIDFGLARDFKGGMTTICGSPAYMAPEIVRKECYDEKCDLFSCGVVLYRMLTWKHPFNGTTPKEMLQSIKTEPPAFPEEDWELVPDPIKKLTDLLLRKDPSERPSAGQVLSRTRARRKSTIALTEEVAKDMLLNCRTYVGRSPVYRTALRCIAYNLDDSKLGPLPKAFLEMDKDGDGKLTREELLDVVRSSLSDKEVEEFERLVEYVDLDHSGLIEYTEFLACTVKPEQFLSTEACQAAFRTLDTEGCGSISLDGLQVFTGVVDTTDSEHQRAEDALKAFDADGSGSLDFEEFQNLLRRKTVEDSPQLVAEILGRRSSLRYQQSLELQGRLLEKDEEAASNSGLSDSEDDDDDSDSDDNDNDDSKDVATGLAETDLPSSLPHHHHPDHHPEQHQEKEDKKQHSSPQGDDDAGQAAEGDAAAAAATAEQEGMVSKASTSSMKQTSSSSLTKKKVQWA